MQHQFKATRRVFFVAAILTGMALACNSGQELTPTAVPVTQTDGSATVEDQLAQIDQMLSQSMNSSFAYNSPTTMTLNANATIELLLNPSLPAEQLESQIQESGSVTTGTIAITSQMKAQLISQDPDAFVIRPLHDDAIQLISGTDTTRWAWVVTAKKSGPQKLVLIIYRLVEYNGQDSWREVRSYQSDIDIQVTLAQRMQSIDWKWIVGIVVTALLIPAFWRLIDRRKKKSKSRSK
jgi:hypothetical protein